MARFKVDGLDSLVQEMEALGESVAGPLAEQMLLAGAEAVKTAWRNSAKAHNHIDTGSMFDHIGYPRKPKQAGDVRSIDIYPQGKDAKGVRNAEKAFILHYGTSKHPGSHWIDDADRECDSTVIPAMEAVFRNGGNGGGVT